MFIISTEFVLCTTCCVTRRSRIASSDVGTRTSMMYISSLIFSTKYLVYRNQLSCTSKYIIFFVFRIWQVFIIRVQRWLKNYLECLFCSVMDLCSLLWLRPFLKIRQRTLGVLNFCNRTASCLMVTWCNLNIGLNTMYRQKIILIITFPTPNCLSCFFYFYICPYLPKYLNKKPMIPSTSLKSPKQTSSTNPH